jgi:hypothetical protein
MLLLAAADPALNPSGGRGPEWGKAAPIALLIILLMGIALFLLIRSMNSQLRKVPGSFLGGAAPPVAGGAEEHASSEAPERTPSDPRTPPGDTGPPSRS